ncbi:hypothetical protein PGB90_000168 [Kerria lacca]
MIIRKKFENVNIGDFGFRTLAFCDWSELQKTRRELLKDHTCPKIFSTKFQQLDTFINEETNHMLHLISTFHNKPVAFKPFLLHTLNQGYSVDFMPWMLPFYRRHFNQFHKWTKYIRNFMAPIVNERYCTWKPGKKNYDYIDTLIRTIRRKEDKEINLEIAMFSLEDVIGGHSAIANFLMKVFAYIAVRPEIQMRIREEIKSVTKEMRNVRLTDRRSMPFTEAVILETIRLIASPIVPHVASQDSSIAGYKIRKGTLIFLNNYELNYSPELWENPEEFYPERFLIDGYLVKPDHFFPFSSGRRSCIGYKMVQLLSFSIVSLTLQKFQIKPVEGCSYEVPVGNLALSYDTFKFQFIP